MRFGIAHIHSHQHLSPILCFSTTCTGVDFQHGIHAVLLSSKHIFQFKSLDFFDGMGINCINLLFGDEFFLVEIEGRFQFVAERFHLCVALEPLFNSLDKLHLLLCTFLVIPETRRLRTELFLFVLYLFRVDVEVAVQLFRAFLDFLELFLCYHSSYIFAICSL